ncbi:hypothetical protein DSLASN_28370 [Desulfoluna limicola]|uniref:Transposase n=1 Tax=Desulfoluna limicola TaxID=2810562 RepID=A0ABM7PIK0_9BACT|nr:hypothetical protein DSLASN_28370 [Desulfoluna limicola]
MGHASLPHLTPNYINERIKALTGKTAKTLIAKNRDEGVFLIKWFDKASLYYSLVMRIMENRSFLRLPEKD